MRMALEVASSVLAAGMIVAWHAPASAQQAGAAAPAMETEAVDAVKKMGAYLSGLESFALSADTTRDDITETGQNVEFASHLELKARRPDRLRLDVTSDSRQRQYFYDGTTVTVYSPITGAFGVVDTPPTIRETIEVAALDYDLEVPLADLFLWGTDSDDVDALTDAFVVGPSSVDGIACDHYAFRQEGVDWQIWIRSEDPPLPCKLVITTTSEESRPRYEATLTWDTGASMADGDFVFTPKDEDYEILIQPASAVTQSDSAQ